MMKRAIYYGLLAAVFAIATLDVSAQKYPERRTTRQGTQLYKKGDFTGAEAEYRRALELNPELREASFNLGGALWRQAQEAAAAGQGEEQQQAIQAQAQEASQRWMTLATDSLAPAQMASAAGYNAGNVALTAQQLDAAIEAYKMSLRLKPDDMEAKFNLAYAQKLKQQQDQNKDQNQDQNNEGGGNDQNQDQNQDQDQNQNQDGDGQNDPGDGDGDPDDQNGNNGNGNNDSDNPDGNEPPPPSGQGQGEAKIDPATARQMLDAMQAAEDDTREKVNAKEVQVGARSGKNW